MKTISEYMLSLSETLKKEREITDTTVGSYLRILFTLNGDKPFKNLAFLKNFDIVQNKLNELADSTQKTYLACMTSALSTVKDKVAYKKTYNHWHEKMMESAKADREKDTSEKTVKEDKNWMSWKDVLAVRAELEKKVDALQNNKMITNEQYDVILHDVILSLYTELPPRRNQDYQHMFVVKKWTDKEPTDRNYLDHDGKQFVFNVYKTAKTHGQQKIAIPESLWNVIKVYLKFHPTHKGSKKFASSFAFLVSADGSALTAVNAITRVLNKVFGKNVAASMLRHIYLSDKYNVTEMKKDADAMGHSMTEQREYLKADEPKISSVDPK